MPGRRISPLFAVLVAFVVLMASNAWLKSIFGYGEIATDIPFLLAGAILFLAWRFNRRAANQRNDLLGSPVSATVPTCGSWKRTGIS
jgi:type IV secretion system protein VirD4